MIFRLYSYLYREWMCRCWSKLPKWWKMCYWSLLPRQMRRYEFKKTFIFTGFLTWSGLILVHGHYGRYVEKSDWRHLLHLREEWIKRNEEQAIMLGTHQTKVLVTILDFDKEAKTNPKQYKNRKICGSF